MKRLYVMVGLCLLAASAAIGSGYGQDKKDGDKKDPQPGGKATLPANWGKIGLTADQKKKVYAVRNSYGPKIDDLKKQIEHLREEEYQEMYKVLNDDQKAALKKIADKGGDPGKGDDKKDDKKDEK